MFSKSVRLQIGSKAYLQSACFSPSGLARNSQSPMPVFLRPSRLIAPDPHDDDSVTAGFELYRLTIASRLMSAMSWPDLTARALRILGVYAGLSCRESSFTNFNRCHVLKPSITKPNLRQYTQSEQVSMPTEMSTLTGLWRQCSVLWPIGLLFQHRQHWCRDQRNS